jgi:hypothetical protein
LTGGSGPASAVARGDRDSGRRRDPSSARRRSATDEAGRRVDAVRAGCCSVTSTSSRSASSSSYSSVLGKCSSVTLELEAFGLARDAVTLFVLLPRAVDRFECADEPACSRLASRSCLLFARSWSNEGDRVSWERILDMLVVAGSTTWTSSSSSSLSSFPTKPCSRVGAGPCLFSGALPDGPFPLRWPLRIGDLGDEELPTKRDAAAAARAFWAARDRSILAIGITTPGQISCAVDTLQ